MEFIFSPWPWYVSGPLIALVMFLLIFTGKHFGMSSNLETMCSAFGAGGKVKYFDFDWKKERWNLIVLVGAIIGGFIGAHLLSNGNAVDINPDTVALLKGLGIESAGETYLPEEIFALEALSNFKVLSILLGGGIMIGFGARYAGGCTSGHAITGLSNLQVPSLIAVIGFFVGGLAMVHLLFPIIF
jgi:uncharacterized protein